MTRAPLSTSSVLDETVDIVARAAAPWAAVVAATSLPYRFMQVLFIERLTELGSDATHYGRALGWIANLTILAFILSRWGRAVWVRACRLSEGNETTPGREAWRVPFVAFVSYLFVAAIAELLYYATAITVVGPIFAMMLAGLAAGTIELNTRPGMLPPLRLIARYSRTTRQLAAFMFIFFVATLVAFINLVAAFGAGEWLVHAFAGVNLARWDVLLGFSNRHYVFLLIAGAIVIVEPFWIAAHVVLVRRAGVAQTGEDLRAWFRALVVPGGMTLITLLLFTSGANAMTLPDYIASLERMRNEPRELAASEAKALMGADVDAPAGRFTADASLLDSIVNKRSDATSRLDATIAALKRFNTTSPPAADAKLLERIRNEERVHELRAGGEVLIPPEGDSSILDRIAAQILKGMRWVRDKVVDFYEWLEKFWPKPPPRQERQPFGGVPFIVTALVIVIVAVLAVVALEVLRRSRRAKPDAIATSDPVASRRDEDPLSRGATEWERYAAQLAAAGRIREAIRAWYHAVLVTCYGAGILNFRKGRTNWEYVSMMRADVAWRPQFADLTRRYEREWYGRDESTYESLDDCSNRAQSILEHVRRRGPA